MLEDKLAHLADVWLNKHGIVSPVNFEVTELARGLRLITSGSGLRTVALRPGIDKVVIDPAREGRHPIVYVTSPGEDPGDVCKVHITVSPHFIISNPEFFFSREVAQDLARLCEEEEHSIKSVYENKLADLRLMRTSIDSALSIC